MGQLLGFAILFAIIYAIIYYPFVKPLIILSKGEIVFRNTPIEKQITDQKIFSIVITAYHLILSLIVLIIGVINFPTKNNYLEDSSTIGYTFLIMAIFLIIVICFGVTLYYLIIKEKNKENIAKLGFIIPNHSIIGIFCSFLLGGHLYFNLNQKSLGVLMFLMLFIEVIYIITTFKFQKKTGVNWNRPTTEKPKSS